MDDLQSDAKGAVASLADVSELWSDFAQIRTAPGSEGWRFAMDHPRLRSYVYDHYLGGKDPFSWVMSTILPDRPLRALEIGCGGGDLAVALYRTGKFVEIDAIDLSEGAVELAKKKAKAASASSLNFYAKDCNNLTLQENHYDFIYSSQALHHIEGLEQLFAQIEKSLVPDGIFFAEDYVGPSRMQYDEYQIQKLNEVFKSLPVEKRRDAWFGDVIKNEIIRVPVEDYLRIDPSEGVRAADILEVASRYLFVKTAPLGMSIAYETLSGIVRNFNPNDPADNIMIDNIIAADMAATKDRLIPTCFATIVGRKFS
jgi:2-polyprenyl-3-methyl-5-hydroxy-6-metoxy-1,4-benzoquinol methylase